MYKMEDINRRNMSRPSKIDPFRRESKYSRFSLSSLLTCFNFDLVTFILVMETMNHLYFLMGGDQLKACWYFQKLFRLPKSVREIMMAKVAEYHSRNEPWFTFDDDEFFNEGMQVTGEMYPQFDMSRLPEEMQIYLPPLESVSSTDSVRRAVKRIRLSSCWLKSPIFKVIPLNFNIPHDSFVTKYDRYETCCKGSQEQLDAICNSKLWTTWTWRDFQLIEVLKRREVKHWVNSLSSSHHHLFNYIIDQMAPWQSFHFEFFSTIRRISENSWKVSEFYYKKVSLLSKHLKDFVVKIFTRSSFSVQERDLRNDLQ